MPSIARPTTFVPSARFSHRKATLLATVVAAAGAGAVTVAVVDDGGSGAGSQSLSPTAPEAVHSMRSERVISRPVAGATVQPTRSTAVPSMRSERVISRPIAGR